jgi:hypothetical protein
LYRELTAQNDFPGGFFDQVHSGGVHLNAPFNPETSSVREFF